LKSFAYFWKKQLILSCLFFTNLPGFSQVDLIEKLRQSQSANHSVLEGFSMRFESLDEAVWQDLPGIAHSKLAKEGIQEQTPYRTQTIGRLRVQAPFGYFYDIEACRKQNREPQEALLVSFLNLFQNDLGTNCHSPLAHDSQKHYQFEIIAQPDSLWKVLVKPFRTGERFFKGFLLLSQDAQLTGYDLSVLSDNIQYHFEAQYTPVERSNGTRKWLPQRFRAQINGKLFGFVGSYLYEVQLSDFQETKELKITEKIAENQPNVQEVLNIQEVNFDIVQLRTVLRGMHKNMLRLWSDRHPKSRLLRTDQINVAPDAWQKNDDFWDKAYLNKIKEKDNAQLSFFNFIQKQKFSPTQLFFSRSFFLGSLQNGYYPWEVYYKSPVLDFNFNTVEGFVLNTGVNVRRRWGMYKWAELEILGRKSVSLDKEGIGYAKLRYKTETEDVSIAMGHFVSQINPENPISYEMNSLSTLLLKNNQMKIFEKQFVNLSFTKRFSSTFLLRGQVEWARRYQMDDGVMDYYWINLFRRPYQTNVPETLDKPNPAFETHPGVFYNFQLLVRPTLRYSIRNQVRTSDWGSSPLLMFKVRGAMPLGETKVDFLQLEASAFQSYRVAPRTSFGYIVNAGVFVKQPNYILDYKHFNGAVTLVQSGDALASHRLMGFYSNLAQGSHQRLQINNYLYSTSSHYLETMCFWNFQGLALSRLKAVQKAGIRESLFLNHTFTALNKRSYLEAGYGIDGIFRVLRVEVIGSFLDGKFQGIGGRININTRFRVSVIPD
jgi:Family of unknown function (DUF5686)